MDDDAFLVLVLFLFMLFLPLKHSINLMVQSNVAHGRRSNYVEAGPARRPRQTTEEMRRTLGVACDLSDDEQAAALAESLFCPPSDADQLAPSRSTSAAAA